MRRGAVLLSALALAALATGAGAGADDEALTLIAAQSPDDGAQMMADAMRAYGCSFDEAASDDFGAFAIAHAAEALRIDAEAAVVQDALAEWLSNGFDALAAAERVTFGIGTGVIALTECP